MIFLQYMILLFTICSVSILYYILNTFAKHFDKNKFFKAVSLVLLAFFFVRYMSGNDAITNTLLLDNAEFQNKFLTFLSLLSNWILYAIELLLILFPFFKEKYLVMIVKFFVLPFGILCIIIMPIASMGITGKEQYFAYNYRAILMAFEIAIVVIYGLIIFFENDKFKTTKKDFFKLFYIVPLMLLATMPTYTIQGLFGYANLAVEIKGLNVYHRTIIYFAILLPIFLYFLLHKKNSETCRLCLLYISVGTLISFSLFHKFESFLTITSWPFHLCNTAMYIVPLCLIFKWKRLFYFSLFINVLGAFFALMMPNYSSTLNLFDMSLVNFYLNHYIAVFMPILVVALKVFERPKLKQFLYSLVGFAGYFLLVLILNAWFSNYATVDYFFINSNFIADKLGSWAEKLRDVVLQFKINDLTFKFYPLYQFLFFLVYVLLSGAMWFLYSFAYQEVDTLHDIADRKRKIKLDEFALMSALNGRSEEEPMDESGDGKLVITNLSKRYGSSNIFAVKDANLVVNSGEVFGFLGPNGAGKSTIIKSIVGIQPITSGDIKVWGYDVEKQPVMAKRQIGYVPDHYVLYEKLTGREYVNYIADLYGVSKEDREKAINKYVSLFNLTDAFDNSIQTYSHGMKQKISIISALVHNPKIWILDEPLIGLDPDSIFQVKECMKEHVKAGNIVFFSSHIIDLVEKVCDHIAIIKSGHILATKSVAEIEKEMPLEKYYLQMATNSNVEATKVVKDAGCEVGKTVKVKKTK